MLYHLHHLSVDRGILMTFGNGMHGALGHGSHNDVVQAKIVEHLIGFEVEQVGEILHPPRINKQKEKQNKQTNEKRITNNKNSLQTFLG